MKKLLCLASLITLFSIGCMPKHHLTDTAPKARFYSKAQYGAFVKIFFHVSNPTDKVLVGGIYCVEKLFPNNAVYSSVRIEPFTSKFVSVPVMVQGVYTCEFLQKVSK